MGFNWLRLQLGVSAASGRSYAPSQISRFAPRLFFPFFFSSFFWPKVFLTGGCYLRRRHVAAEIFFKKTKKKPPSVTRGRRDGGELSSCCNPTKLEGPYTGKKKKRVLKAVQRLAGVRKHRSPRHKPRYHLKSGFKLMRSCCLSEEVRKFHSYEPGQQQHWEIRWNSVPHFNPSMFSFWLFLFSESPQGS